MSIDARRISLRLAGAGLLILAVAAAARPADETPAEAATPTPAAVPRGEIDRSPANMWRHGKAYPGFSDGNGAGCYGCNGIEGGHTHCCRCCLRALSEPGGGPCTWCLDHCLYRIIYPVSPWYTNPRDGRLYPAYGTAAPPCTYID